MKKVDVARGASVRAQTNTCTVTTDATIYFKRCKNGFDRQTFLVRILVSSADICRPLNPNYWPVLQKQTHSRNNSQGKFVPVCTNTGGSMSTNICTTQNKNSISSVDPYFCARWKEPGPKAALSHIGAFLRVWCGNVTTFGPKETQEI